VATLDRLAQVESQLTRIAEQEGDIQVDSLLRWTVLLKDQHSDAALAYARSATELATENGY
jgi:hypothetical protein